MMKLIGYGLMHWAEQDSFPFIPHLLIVEENGVNKCISRTNEHGNLPTKFNKIDPIPYFEGMWAAIEENGAVLFEISAEKEWRSKRSQELVQEALNLKGNPLKKLELTVAAGILQNMDVPELSKRIHKSMITYNESLEDAFLREKKCSI